MLRTLYQLVIPTDLVTPATLVAAFLLLGGVGLLGRAVHTPVGLVGGALVVALVGLGLVWARARARHQCLHEGRCPYPLCNGIVQHSSRVSHGHVLCPTCGRAWPDIRGIHFRITHKA